MPNLRPSTLAFALSLLVAVGATDAQAQKKKRSTAKKPVVEKIDACSDFYTYTHKAWLDANLHVAGSGMTTAMSQLRERALQQQIDLLNSDMQTAQGGIGKLLGDFWASGLDEAAVETDGANPIAPLLDRINGIRRDKDIAPAIAALHQVGIPALFNRLLEERRRAPARIEVFFASHPLEEDRIVATEREIEAIAPSLPPGLRQDDPSYQAFKEHLARLPRAPERAMEP